MNAVSSANYQPGVPATAVIRIRGDRLLASRLPAEAQADEVGLAAVKYPPRLGEAKPISALLPEVLARYGLAETASVEGRDYGAVADEQMAGLDLLA